MKSVFVVITGPSGAGKSSVAQAVLERIEYSRRLVTTSTRKPRPEELEGQDYFFCSREEFAARRGQGEFLEWEENYGNLYGSSRAELRRMMVCYPVVIAIPDVRGALSMKKEFPEAMTVFISPGSITELRERLEQRDGPSAEVEGRISAGRRILAQAGDFDHVVFNLRGRLDVAVGELVRLIAERQK